MWRLSRLPPLNEAGYCSLGVAVDVSRQAMEQASLDESFRKRRHNCDCQVGPRCIPLDHSTRRRTNSSQTRVQ